MFLSIVFGCLVAIGICWIISASIWFLVARSITKQID